jgi:hypothetical protein
MEYQLAAQGVEVKKDICEHFPWSRQEITTWCASTISAPSSS